MVDINEILRKIVAEEAANKAARRKCFVSYYGGDTTSVDEFIENFGDVFIPKVIGTSDGDDFINSDNPDYVMSRIREKYLGDSTVTLCMIGDCTHSRRYVDWELKTTLRQGSYTPNGLIGILLPYKGTSGHLPQRLKDNWISNSNECYAMYKSYPTSKEQLREWIEEAFSRRTSHAKYIQNSQEMFKYNRSCKIHETTH